MRVTALRSSMRPPRLFRATNTSKVNAETTSTTAMIRIKPRNRRERRDRKHQTTSLYPTPVTVSIFTVLAAIFLAQVGNVHIHRAGLTEIIIAPGQLEELLAGEHHAFMLDES